MSKEIARAMLTPGLNDNKNQPPSQQEEPFYRTTKFWLIVLGILIVIIFIQHNPFRNKKNTTPPVPVVVSTARNADVSVYLNELGGVVPVSTITVKTQLNGQLWHVYFTEGQMVKKGQLLAEIDPRPYQAQLEQYQGQLLHDQALLANALIDLKRYKTLWKQDSVAKQVLDTQVALVRQYQGAVQTDQGLIAGVNINLIYTRIISPVDGRVGLRLVDAGNFVQTTDTTGIAVIDTLNPNTVIFSIPEDNIPDVLNQINAGQTLTVKAYDRQQSKLLAVGTLLTIDNQIDSTTGMVKMRAQFQNDQNTLFPNQFVNISLLVKNLINAIIIPTAAIQHGPQNSYVYVVNANNTVSIKSVVTSVVSGNDTVISSGVLPGQYVVTEGADQLTEGAAVTIADPAQSTQPSEARKAGYKIRRIDV